MISVVARHLTGLAAIRPRRNGRGGRLGRKRIVDTVLVLVTAPVTLPVAVVTGLLVLVNMGSPVFYCQERVGLGEKSFQLLKFRSMLPETDEEGRVRPDSKRIPRFGHLLRASSLDELPQLLNVLVGDMSLVGPRPLPVEYRPFYTDNERIRHSVRPGITGAAQVNGRNSLDWEDRLAYDVDYASRATVLDDLRILGKTVLRVLDRSDTVTEYWDHFEDFDVYRSYPADGTFALRRIEPRDEEIFRRWGQAGAPPPEMRLAVAEETVDFLGWLRQVREDSTRRDLSVYETGSRRLVAAVGWESGLDPKVARLYLWEDPELADSRTRESALGLLLQLLWSRKDFSGAVLTSPNAELAATAQRYAFREDTDAAGLPGQLRLDWAGEG